MNFYIEVRKFMGPEKTKDLLNGWTPMSCKRQVQKIKDWLRNQSILSEDRKKELAQKKEKSPVDYPQASTRNNTPQQVPEKGNKALKSNQKGKQALKSK
ncbi:hypothetical protein O181_040109 [Austropuccinia psidii MF-1]|uniref:Uncharacterized protein n=1 Tax=Austropuccinia psidii MF-1 TaxID=1389203 RepID=A0A9Q3HF69_9BASI|nr:hypothetical protein [Austropuccinia psidii MF-1]